MSTVIEVDGRTFDVTFDEDAGEVTVDGVTWPCKVRDGRALVIRVGPQTFTVTLDGDGQATIDGRSTQYTVKAAPGVGSTADGAAGGEIHPPMTGKVDAVLVEPGQEVATGDVLFVLEAMKMRNEVKAPRDGTVDQVLVSAGQTVEPGVVAVRLVALA